MPSDLIIGCHSREQAIPWHIEYGNQGETEQGTREGAGRKHELTSEIVERGEDLTVKGHRGQERLSLLFNCA